MKPLEKEYQYYTDHLGELYKKYGGKVIVIIEEEVVGVYENELQAVVTESKKRKPGTFFVKRCEEVVTPQVFHTRVAFI
jgi:NAD dependent epimerase/dehydratase family enzyme